MDYHDEYFDMQSGYDVRTGYGGISHVYIGSPNQRGHGIGSLLGGLFRRVLPLLKHRARAVGKEAVRSGIIMATDIMDSDVHPEAFKRRLRESGENLKRKAEEKISSLMKGTGYRAGKINKLLHSFAESVTRCTRVKKRKKTTKSRKHSSGLKNTRRKKKTTVQRRAAKAPGKKRNKKPRIVTDIFA